VRELTAPADVSRPAASPRVISYQLDDDTVVYDEATREGFILNGTASRIWALADGSRTAASLARSIAEAYGIPYKEARDDVDEFVTELSQAGLLAS